MSLGYYLLLLAFIASAYTIWAGASGIRLNRKSLVKHAELAVYGQFVLVTLTIILLVDALLTRDFSIRYVAEYSDRQLPLLYTLSALYAGQAGSLLLWTWLLSIFNALYVLLNRKKEDEFKTYVLLVINGVTFFFLILVNYATNPFEKISPVPPDGMGLNPLLQNPEMIFHPPSLFLGFVGFTIPFAYAMAALMKGDISNDWLDRSRNWTLFAWIALTIGNLLGAQWAYVELGWGGYWAWDPVENASLLPWLTGTAFVHSIMAQKYRHLMKAWNIVLAILTFLLTILGTFITRSGIISSVHAFGKSNLGTLFLIFMILVLTVSVVLIVLRSRKMQSEHQIDAYLSRDFSFLLVNLIFTVLLVMVLVGTLYPAITELFIGKQITLGEPYFNKISVPIGIFLLLLLAICPVFSWRETSGQTIIKRSGYPVALSILFVILLLVFGVNHIRSLLTLGIGFLGVAIIIAEIIASIRERMKAEQKGFFQSSQHVFKINTRRYAAYLIHIGVILIYLAIVGTTVYKHEKQITLQQGQETTLGNYRLVYNKLDEKQEANRDVLVAEVDVFTGPDKLTTLYPRRNFYHSAMGQTQYTTEVAVRSTFKEDLYLILASYQEDGSATFTFLVNPLQIWMWIGGGVITLGIIIILIHASQHKKSLPQSVGITDSKMHKRRGQK
ncbi:MAG: heme lyase CcmF/NrfE family subunit [candidate division KSB1 bacterium]|nr:heme lyase CcmF/NrfE family subunit [candidate division KSB1 bacterium]